jgi:hypothetical protein
MADTANKERNYSPGKFQVFKSGHKSMQMILKGGTPVAFSDNGKGQGVFMTKIPEVASELDDELDAGVNTFFRDTKQMEVTDAEAAPLEAERATIRAEIMAELAARGIDLTPKPNAGYYENPPLNVATSVSAAPISAEANRARMTAKPIPSQPNATVNQGQGVNVVAVPATVEATETVTEDGEVKTNEDMETKVPDTTGLDALVASNKAK